MALCSSYLVHVRCAARKNFNTFRIYIGRLIYILYYLNTHIHAHNNIASLHIIILVRLAARSHPTKSEEHHAKYKEHPKMLPKVHLNVTMVYFRNFRSYNIIIEIHPSNSHTR